MIHDNNNNNNNNNVSNDSINNKPPPGMELRIDGEAVTGGHHGRSPDVRG